jgi:hypothetical protein
MEHAVFDDRVRLLEVRIELMPQVIDQIVPLLARLTQPRKERTAAPLRSDRSPDPQSIISQTYFANLSIVF